MALDPNIPLQRAVQPVNLLQAITSGVQAGNAIRMAPLLQEAQRLSNQAQQQNLQVGQMQMQGMDRQQAMQSIGTLRNVAGQLLQMPSTQRATYLQQIAPQLQQMGIDPAQISANDLSDESLAGFVSRANAIIPQEQATPSETREIKIGDSIVTQEWNPASGQWQTIAEGERFSSTPQTMVTVGGEGRDYGDPPANMVWARDESGNVLLEADPSRPDVRRPVAVPIAGGPADVGATNQQAYQAFSAGLDNLSERLGATRTGYVQGLLPAISESQQAADAAISTMMPLLKDVFRGAGEGTFTDNDQRILEDMIPTRGTAPGLVASQLENIDRIVRAKLGLPLGQDSPSAQQSGRFTIEAVQQ